MGNPLADYLNSLRELRDYEVDLVLPAHGDEFLGLQKRIDELLAHHEERLHEIRAILATGAQTSYDVATAMRWRSSTPWTEMPGFQRRMATTETIAHLELMHARGEVQRSTAEGGRVLYALVPG
jgi:glyoxylase-like metal-dependent hydrolase (beta-lactamase superfamily II)